jgi:hypothetical protein
MSFQYHIHFYIKNGVNTTQNVPVFMLTKIRTKLTYVSPYVIPILYTYLHKTNGVKTAQNVPVSMVTKIRTKYVIQILYIFSCKKKMASKLQK